MPAPHLPTQPIICPCQFHLLFHQISLKSTHSPNLHCFQSTSSYWFPTFIPPIHSPQRVNLSKYSWIVFLFCLKLSFTGFTFMAIKSVIWSTWLWVTNAAYLSDSVSFHSLLLTPTFYTLATLALIVLLRTTTLHLPT